MATYVLLHGAGSDGWYWHLVVPELEARGHRVLAPDLISGEGVGFAEQAKAVADELLPAEPEQLVVVAQSLGGFVAPLLCRHVRVDLLVMVVAMCPRPGETFTEWWESTGWETDHRAQMVRDGRDPDREDLDVEAEFFNDVPPDVTAAAFARPERESGAGDFDRPWPLDGWPDVPTRFLLGTLDRFFPPDFQRRVVPERLGITPDEIDTGHLPALSKPKELAERLERYREELPEVFEPGG